MFLINKKGTNVLGAKTAMELRGVPCIDLQIDQEKKKTAAYQDHLEEKVTEIEELEESVTTHCLNAAENRADDQLAKTITVFVRTSPLIKVRNIIQIQKR